MPDTPQRPFVPHRTPKQSPEFGANSEFLLARPFVPGDPSLPSIGEFVEQGEPAAAQIITNYLDDRRTTSDGGVRDSFAGDGLDDLPPVEHFTDPLPPVMAFAPDSVDALPDANERLESPLSTEEGNEESGWIVDDWQQYDWRGAAALGDGPETEASNDWATTDWEVSPPLSRGRRPTAAEEIASALDQIAQRRPLPPEKRDPSIALGRRRLHFQCGDALVE